MDNIVRKAGRRTKLTTAQGLEIRKKYSDGSTLRELAAEYKVSVNPIYNVIKGTYRFSSEAE